MSNAVVLITTGLNDDGHRKVRGMRVSTSETAAAWSSFFADPSARGLGGDTGRWVEGCRNLRVDILARCRLHVVPASGNEMTHYSLPALIA